MQEKGKVTVTIQTRGEREDEINSGTNLNDPTEIHPDVHLVLLPLRTGRWKHWPEDEKMREESPKWINGLEVDRLIGMDE